MLTEADLTLTKAIELSVGVEAADKNAKSLKGTESSIKSITPGKACYRCGRTSHDQKDCRFKDAECHNCGKRGHIAPVCRSPKKKRQPRRNNSRRPGLGTKYVTTTHDQEPESEEDDESLPLYTVGGGATPPIKVPLLVDGKSLTMELDTGAAVTIVSEKQYKDLFPHLPLQESQVLLKTYSGEQLPVVSEVRVQVQYEQQIQDLVLTVVAGEGPCLLGRNWLQHLKLNWRDIKAVSQHAVGSLDYLLDKYGDLFVDELGTIKSFSAKLHVNPQDKPKFYKARTVTYALKSVIDDELDRLEREGILEKVTHSEWATPIVAVPKRGGSVRLCGDFKVTVNQSLSVDQYPLPKADDLFDALAGGRKFTKLDLTQAYLQLLLDPESKTFCTINTHCGLYQITCLPF